MDTDHISETQLHILRSLARFRFLTPSQITLLGIRKYPRNLYAILNKLLQRRRSPIGKNYIPHRAGTLKNGALLFSDEMGNWVFTQICWSRYGDKRFFICIGLFTRLFSSTRHNRLSYPALAVDHGKRGQTGIRYVLRTYRQQTECFGVCKKPNRQRRPGVDTWWNGEGAHVRRKRAYIIMQDVREEFERGWRFTDLA